MPRKKPRKSADDAPPPPKPADDEEEDSDDDSDSEDAGLRVDDHEEKEASLEVDFGFFDPKSEDFHGVRALLASGDANALLPSAYDVGGLSDVICEQAAVGSVAKVIAADSEEPAQPEDVLGFLTAVNLRSHREAAFVKEFRASVTQRCAGDASAKDRLAAILADQHTGLIVSCRMVNLPGALVPSLVESLMKDLAWAIEEAEPEAERATYRFGHLLLLAAVEMPTGGGEGASSAASAGPSGGGGGGDGGGGGGGGKKRKKAAAAAAMDRAAQLESLTFGRMEEEILAAAADFTVLLNGAGRTRQLLLAITPDAIRQAVPAMHAAMGEQ